MGLCYCLIVKILSLKWQTVPLPLNKIISTATEKQSMYTFETTSYNDGNGLSTCDKFQYGWSRKCMWKRKKKCNLTQLRRKRIFIITWVSFYFTLCSLYKVEAVWDVEPRDGKHNMYTDQMTCARIINVLCSQGQTVTVNGRWGKEGISVLVVSIYSNPSRIRGSRLLIRPVSHTHTHTHTHTINRPCLSRVSVVR